MRGKNELLMQCVTGHELFIKTTVADRVIERVLG